MTDVCTHLDRIQATSLPERRSLAPGQDWRWCYEDEIGFEVDLAGTGR